MGRSGYFTMPKMPMKTEAQCIILQSFIDLFPLFIYLPLNLFFYLKRKKLSCKLLTSLQILNILMNSFYFLMALFFLSE